MKFQIGEHVWLTLAYRHVAKVVGYSLGDFPYHVEYIDETEDEGPSTRVFPAKEDELTKMTKLCRLLAGIE